MRKGIRRWKLYRFKRERVAWLIKVYPLPRRGKPVRRFPIPSSMRY